MRTVVGVGLIGAGGVMVFGALTGRLAPMIAALFVPSALQTKSGGGSSVVQDIGREGIINWLLPGDFQIPNPLSGG